jgi:hypothetical protein
MPDPISSSTNSSVYDPSLCDDTRTSCMEPPEPKVVTLPEVVIEGRVPRTPPSCEQQRTAFVVGCTLGIAPVVLSIAEKGVLLPSAAASAVKEGMACGKLVSDYLSCLRDGAARTAVANSCEATGGTPVQGVEKNEIVCLK